MKQNFPAVSKNFNIICHEMELWIVTIYVRKLSEKEENLCYMNYHLTTETMIRQMMIR